MEQLKSNGKRVKQEFNYDEKFTVTKLTANKDTVDKQREQLQKMNSKLTPEQIERQITNIVVRENVFNAIMAHIVSYYEFNLDSAEIEKFAQRFQNVYKNANPDVAKKIAENMLKKAIIYKDLASLWDIRTTEEETKTFLQNYYKQTNNPIRDILNNKDQFDNFSQMIQDEKITNQILQRFRNVTLDLPRKEENKEQKPQ